MRVLGALSIMLSIAFLGSLAVPASAGQTEQSVAAGDVLVYLGVVPTARLGDPALYAKHNRQCPVPGGRNRYHVMVALFDRSSGERIIDAVVEARVSSLGLVGPKKRLGAVTVANAVTYCNYFKLLTSETYEVRLKIRRPGTTEPIRAKFAYKPPRE